MREEGDGYVEAEDRHDEDAADAVAGSQLQLRLDLVLAELGLVARVHDRAKPASDVRREEEQVTRVLQTRDLKEQVGGGQTHLRGVVEGQSTMEGPPRFHLPLNW